MSEKTIYKRLSEERKRMQEEGTMPEFFTTAAWQFFKSKYMYGTDTVKGQYERIAATAAQYLKDIGLEDVAREKFFNMLWKGWLSPSTPVLANMGTDRGLCVSCEGGYVQDSINGFYSHSKECAILSKNGFGTSGYLGDIRSRGAKISKGGKASGAVPVFKMLVETSRNVSQGGQRRGAWAGYLPIDHGDFDELCDYVFTNPDDANVGWCVSDKFIERLKNNDSDAIRRYQKALKTKMVVGKGYFFFPDKVNRQNPKMYKDKDFEVLTSNLCNEITLFTDEKHTFTCVLSSMNIAKYDEWKDTDTVFWATVFLDCVAEDFIQNGRKIDGIENAIRFTEKGRALGLGVCGFHTYLQKNMIPFESLQAQFFNNELFSKINLESLKASQWLAEQLGEPEWCKGYGVRNTHRIAIAPTKTTATLIGNVSEGINPDPAMTFLQQGAAGEISRINGILVDLMKVKGVYSKKHIDEIISADGSVQGVNWLTEAEKEVFKTAFEINMEVVVRLASLRQKFICQGQSLNLYFSESESGDWISHIHKQIFEDALIKGSYYIYTKSGVKGSKECVACS